MKDKYSVLFDVLFMFTFIARNVSSNFLQMELCD